MTYRAKTELFLIHTDENGVETLHKIKVKNLDKNIETAKWWVNKAVAHQEWEDNQPEAGMGSGCW